MQVLRLCREAGLVKLGHVALDGTKLKAKASKHKAMSYGRMVRAEAALAAEVAGWLARAEREDAADDAEHGPEKRGDELPDWVKDKEARLERIRAAKAALEADATHQIVVAQRLTTDGSDQDGLVPLLDAAAAALGRKPREVSADAGFCREANLEALAARRIRGYLAPGRAGHGTPDPSGRRRTKPGSPMARMAVTLKRAGRRSRYRWRKQTVEPVLGQIKHARGFRQFLLRGFAKVEAEWTLVCTAHNLAKLRAARAAPTA